jgi:hypothetical protein
MQYLTGVTMTTAVFTGITETPIGMKTRKLRRSMKLTLQQVADMASVSKNEVRLFEHSEPVRLDVRRRILKELWALRSGMAVCPG